MMNAKNFVAGGLRFVGNNAYLLAKYFIEKSRLTYIWSPSERYRSALLRQGHLPMIDQLKYSMPSANRHGAILGDENAA